MDKYVYSAFRVVYYNSLVSDNVHKSTSQVDTGRPTGGPTRPLTETPPLLAPNVFSYGEVLLQPRFTGERDIPQCRAVKGTAMFPGNVECMTKGLPALALRSSECSQTDTSSLLIPNASVAQLCCSSNISPINMPADSSRFLSRRPEV